jgi:hypothetical protein
MTGNSNIYRRFDRVNINKAVNGFESKNPKKGRGIMMQIMD